MALQANQVRDTAGNPAAARTLGTFTANVSANAVFNESTFTGGSGSTAYTISDVVLALKQLGLLAP